MSPIVNISVIKLKAKYTENKRENGKKQHGTYLEEFK